MGLLEQGVLIVTYRVNVVSPVFVALNDDLHCDVWTVLL